MLKRNYELYLKDILEAISNIEEYVDSMDFEDFESKKMVVDAVLRNLEIIGEAATQIPEEMRAEHNEIPWRDIQDFRIVVAHKYWKVNLERVWDIIENKLDDLRENVERILRE